MYFGFKGRALEPPVKIPDTKMVKVSEANGIDTYAFYLDGVEATAIASNKFHVVATGPDGETMCQVRTSLGQTVHFPGPSPIEKAPLKDLWEVGESREAVKSGL